MKKIYVAFDGDEDIQYFNTLKMWKENERIDFNFSNPHDLNSARDDSAVESIKTQLRKRFDVSNVFMILIGQNTKRLTKFVKWEIETALKRNMKIIVVNLNDKNYCDTILTPTALINEKLVVDYIPFKLNYINQALYKC